MRSGFLIAVCVCCSSAHAVLQADACMGIHGSMGSGMTDAMIEDFSLSEKQFIVGETKMEIVEDVPVNYPLADFYAKRDRAEEAIHFTSLNEIRSIYTEYHPRNIIVKFTYYNKRGKNNVFLTSYVINDYECSIRFNGYIIVKREF
ncbi:hypothetical protein AAGR22_20780 [Erwinia sp. HDF1-3R]|uniref:hypothetical protein n=1 Tax=Erwinia sp. HDF1-3R TaxID=3141543 RepID=UPI0031F52DE0